MTEQMPKFEPKIEQKFEIHFKDADSTYWSAKTLKEAAKRAREIKKRLQEEWKEERSTDKKDEERAEFVDYYTGNYIQFLKKQLWHDTRNKDVPKEIIELKKEVMRILNGILNQKIRVVWHQSYFNDSTHYSIEEVKKGEEVGDR